MLGVFEELTLVGALSDGILDRLSAARETTWYMSKGSVGNQKMLEDNLDSIWQLLLHDLACQPYGVAWLIVRSR
jgi:hypothetical protein